MTSSAFSLASPLLAAFNADLLKVMLVAAFVIISTIMKVLNNIREQAEKNHRGTEAQRVPQRIVFISQMPIHLISLVLLCVWLHASMSLGKAFRTA